MLRGDAPVRILDAVQKFDQQIAPPRRVAEQRAHVGQRLRVGRADHDHGVRVGIGVEELHHIDVLQPAHRIAADADARRLTEPALHQLTDRLVGERAGARDDADAALLVDVAGHDADLDLVRRDHARAIGTEEDRLAALHPAARAHHVHDWDAFGNADDEIEPRVDGFVDRGGGARRRHVDDRYRRAGPVLRFLHRAVDRYAFELLAGFFRIHAGDEALHAVRVLAAHARMELAGLAGDALRDDFRVLVDEDAHRDALRYLPATAATIFCAASAMLSAEMIGSPDSARIFFPMSSFVPFIRTTS